jgi:hypothetical protein
VQEDAVKKLLLAALVATLGLAPTTTPAQTQPEEKVVIGEVQNVDASGTQITLTDGTVLLTPPGAMLRPGAVQQGMQVVAVYREQENGNKILTRLAPGR